MALIFKQFLVSKYLWLAIVMPLVLLGALISSKPQKASRQADIATMVAMSDGIKLETNVWLPDSPPPYPVVLTRGYTAYFAEDYQGFTQAGYAYVAQSARGHSGSQGEMKRFFPDADDGYDTLNWITQQPWSNGNIAMYGKSFWAATQWLVALKQHPSLKAIIPQNMNADIWQCVYRCNGALSLGMTASGRAYNSAKNSKVRRIGWDKFFRHLPLTTLQQQADENVDKENSQLWLDYVQHDTFDEYWSDISIRGDGADGKYQKINIPVYLMGGWYDYYAGAAFTSFQHLEKLHPEQDHRITIDVSNHLNDIVGDRAYSSDAAKNEIALAIRWLDHIIKGEDNGIQNEPPIKIFTMGQDQWNEYQQWPPRKIQMRPYYLAENQQLSEEKPSEPAQISYEYDPENPTPTLGGNHSFIDDSAAKILRAGPVDQSPLEARADVLLFQTSPLEKSRTISGPVTAKIYASTNVTDTDFIVRLLDIQPDGVRHNLTEGIIRARFRKSVWEEPELLEPGEIYEFNIELQPTSNVYKKGHRIGIHLTSSSFPLWDRNPNTGNKQGEDLELKVAQQTIYLSQQHSSQILLPVIDP